MIKQKILLILAILFISNFVVFSQKNPKIDKKTFFTTQEGVEAAQKSFNIAEKYYRKGKGTYDEALKYYLKLYDYNSSSHALNYKIGMCYLFSANKKASLKYLLNSSPEIAKDYYIALGRAYQYNRSFEKAKEVYNTYLNGLKQWQQNEQREKINQFISECDFSKKTLRDSSDVFIVNLGPLINTYYDEYSAYKSPTDSRIFFTSKRPSKEPRKRVSRFKFPEQVYVAHGGINELCESVERFKIKEEIVINGANPNGSPEGKSNSSQTMSKRKNVSMAGVDVENKRVFYYKGGVENGQLLSTKYDQKKSKWKSTKKVKGKINHIAYKETSIAIGPDNTAYFISNRRGSVGGKDIWIADYKKKERWGKPYNLGENINTPFDEEGISLSNDGATLYFSSNGHEGMGGFDVYKSNKQIDGSWSDPINIGYPINSPADELFYHPTPDTMVALYSTIRGDSYGGLDVYKIQIDPRKPFSLIGSVSDVETGDVLSATINVLDMETKLSVMSAKVDTLAGIYMLSFEDVGDYEIQIDKEGYKSLVDTLECPNEKHATIVNDYQLEIIRHPFTLSGRIIDIDNGKPLMASVVFYDSTTNEEFGRKFSDEAGNYSITFEDKFDMLVKVELEDYFSVTDRLLATQELGNFILRDIALKRSKIEYTLTGVITDETNTMPVHGALSFFRPAETEPFAIVVSDSINGKYSATLEEQGPFLIEVEAAGYFFYNETYAFPENQSFTAKNFALKKMATGAKIVVENILFNSGKSTLKASSFKGLDKLAILLIKNDQVRIEVSGHTDNVGSSTINKRISKARALTVKNYLVSRGVESERVEYIGYGFDQPIQSNDTKEGRAANRRVEIKVLE